MWMIRDRIGPAVNKLMGGSSFTSFGYGAVLPSEIKSNIKTFYYIMFNDADYYLFKKEEMFYLTTHSTHLIYGYMASDLW